MLSIRGIYTALIVCAISACGTMTVRAQNDFPTDAGIAISLEEIVDSVRARNPGLLASRLAAEIHLQREREVSLPDPSVSFSYLPRPVFTARGSQKWILRGELDLPFPGKIRREKNVASTDATAASFAAAELENQLVFQAKRAYYRLYRIDRQLQLAREFQNRLKDFEEAATSLYEVGLGHQQEILKSQLERSNLDATIAALEADRRTAEKMLARLQNDDRPIRIEPEGMVELRDPPEVPSDVIADSAMARRPEVALLDALTRSKEAEIALAKRAWLPDLGLHVSYIGIAQEPIPVAADGRDALMVGATVRIPLFGGNINAGVAGAEIERLQLEFDRIAIETDVRTRVDDLTSRIERESEQMKLLSGSLIPQAQTTVEVALSDYTTGRAGFLDLLDAERTLFSFRDRVEETIERYAVAIAELERTVGASIAVFTESGGE
ncbi:MAG TPA: TolC family protein [Rhodothermales bacterium]|nr:TolC family protein [Rhodothermales bacterium]